MRRRVLFALSLFSVYANALRAQSTTVAVSDLLDQPMQGVKLSVAGNGSTSPPTDIAGKTQLLLPMGVQPGDPVKLVLIPGANKNLIFYSPWEGLALVPKPTGFIGVVLGSRGDLAALKNPRVLNSVAATAVAMNRKNDGVNHDLVWRYDAFSELADRAGFSTYDLDKSIREYFAQSDDAQVRTLAKYYHDDYPKPISTLYRPKGLAIEKLEKPEKPN